MLHFLLLGAFISSCASQCIFFQGRSGYGLCRGPVQTSGKVVGRCFCQSCAQAVFSCCLAHCVPMFLCLPFFPPCPTARPQATCTMGCCNFHVGCARAGSLHCIWAPGIAFFSFRSGIGKTFLGPPACTRRYDMPLIRQWHMRARACNIHMK